MTDIVISKTVKVVNVTKAAGDVSVMTHSGRTVNYTNVNVEIQTSNTRTETMVHIIERPDIVGDSGGKVIAVHIDPVSVHIF